MKDNKEIEFYPCDKVIIRSYNNKDYIGGMINSLSKNGSLELFDEIIHVNSCYYSVVEGHIYKIGKHGHYIIICGNRLYCFTNRYNEMEKVKK